MTSRDHYLLCVRDPSSLLESYIMPQNPDIHRPHPHPLCP